MFAAILLYGCKSAYKRYQYDNGDDYFREGLQRIVDSDGRIGFGNERGETVITPQFAFAYPFDDGAARATMTGREVEDGEHRRWQSDEWFYIDHSGKRRPEAETRIREYIGDKNAMTGVAVINAHDPADTIMINADKDFPMMSVFKFPLALALAEWLDRQGRSLDDSVDVGEDELHEDTWSPMLKKYGKRPLRLSYRELVEWSLTQSDNNACDILIARLGGTDKVEALLTGSGVSDKITVKVTEAQMHDDPSLSLRNSSTPRAMARLFERFDKGLSERSANFRETGEMLERCVTGADRLPAPFEGTGAVIGHKTGTGFTTASGGISAINDCGYIIMADGTRYYIAVFVADSEYSPEETSKIIADISEIVKNHFTPAKANR